MKERLKEFRKSIKLTQAEFSSKIGLTQSTYNGYETGYRDIPDVVVKSVCSIYGVSEEWLRNGTGDMFPALSDDEILADRLGSVLSPDASEEKKRLVSSIFDMLDAIPDRYYPIIADAIREVLNAK